MQIHVSFKYGWNQGLQNSDSQGQFSGLKINCIFLKMFRMFRLLEQLLFLRCFDYLDFHSTFFLQVMSPILSALLEIFKAIHTLKKCDNYLLSKLLFSLNAHLNINSNVKRTLLHAA